MNEYPISKTREVVRAEGLQQVHMQWWVTSTLLLIALATLVRTFINFSFTYPPAIDAGYYPMQTRAWMVHGRLVYQDLPLLFLLDAAGARILMLFGQSLDHAVVLSSRIWDCILQPWTAAAVMACGWSWSAGRRRAWIGSIASAAIVVLSPSALVMISNFQKNSLGFVWMGAAVCICRWTLIEPRISRWLALTGVMIAAALTHTGAFAVTALIVSISIAIWLCHQNRKRFIQAIFIFLACLVVVAGVSFAFDSNRTKVLLLSPLILFGWGRIQMPNIFLGILSLGIAVAALRRLKVDRASLSAADIGIVAALAGTLILLIVPKNAGYFGRLLLMAPLPAALLITFIFARRSTKQTPSWPGWALLGLVIVAGFLTPRVEMHPWMNESAAAELMDFKQQLVDPAATLVIAPHGLEWWAGFLLDTPVRMNLVGVDLTRYRRILLLRGTVEFPPPNAILPIHPQPLAPPARPLYIGRFIEIYEKPFQK